MDVSIIIVNYKTADLVVDCIESIKRESNGFSYEIIVVDNNSQDGSVNIIRDACANVIVIENKDNLGFAKANNIGVMNSCGKFLFFLNPDTLLLNNAVNIMLNYYTSHKNIGALGCWMVDGDGEKTLSAAKFSTLSNASDEYLILIKNKFRKNKKQCDKFIFSGDEKETDVDVVIGADLFVNRDDFLAVGQFDQDFFMYHEEMYLCYKLKNELKRRNLIIDGPRIAHLCGKSPKKRIERDIMIDGNLFLYFRKIGIKNISPMFSISFLGIRAMYYIKKRYSINEMQKYFKAIVNNENYSYLRHRLRKVE